MNMVAPRKRRVAIEVVFDFVCPWCYLGISRLMTLAAQHPEFTLQAEWRPFLLNPDMPRAGMSRSDYAIRKFGGEDRARRLFAAISSIAASEGIPFDFNRIERTPNTVDAHRLVRFAAAQNAADAIVLEIFRAYFARGLDISDTRVLVAIAAEIGLDPSAARRLLTSTVGTELVHNENLAAHRLGINGVPCFLLADGDAIAGAQDPDVLERLIELAAMEPRPM